MKYKGAHYQEEEEEFKHDLAALNYFTAAYYYERKHILDEKEKVGDIMLFCRSLIGKNKGRDLIEAITKAFELGCHQGQFRHGRKAGCVKLNSSHAFLFY